MSNTFIQEAFQNAYLTEDAEEFSLNVSGPDDTESFLDIINSDDDEMISDVYDLEAEAKEELKQSYIGKVILDCNVCHSNVFFDKDQITEDEDGLCCVDIECPYCMSNEGYTIIGEVKPFVDEEEPLDEIEDVEVTVSEEEPEIDEPEEEAIESEEVEEDEELFEESLKSNVVNECGNPEIIKEDASTVGSVLGGIAGAVATRSPAGAIKGAQIGGTIGDIADSILGEGCKDNKEELEEDIEDVSITTNDETMTMTTKEDGGVVVETSPKEEIEEVTDKEIIAPIEPETEVEVEDAIEANNEDEEEIPEDEMIIEEPNEEADSEDEFEEFDEESFDELGESYLKRCYENVTSFKTSNISLNENKEFIIEGKIGFDSGNEKNTQFIFSPKTTENGKLKLEGFNKQISKGKKTFKLNCSINNKALICESLNYNYKSKNDLNESVRVYGTVKRK